jgi:hypothetical protein
MMADSHEWHYFQLQLIWLSMDHTVCNDDWFILMRHHLKFQLKWLLLDCVQWWPIHVNATPVETLSDFTVDGPYAMMADSHEWHYFQLQLIWLSMDHMQWWLIHINETPFEISIEMIVNGLYVMVAHSCECHTIWNFKWFYCRWNVCNYGWFLWMTHHLKLQLIWLSIDHMLWWPICINEILFKISIELIVNGLYAIVAHSYEWHTIWNSNWIDCQWTLCNDDPFL